MSLASSWTPNLASSRAPSERAMTRDPPRDAIASRVFVLLLRNKDGPPATAGVRGSRIIAAVGGVRDDGQFGVRDDAN